MGQRTLVGFVYGQWKTPCAVAKADLTGKTVVVVGANTGIGFEAACHFARMSPGKLIMACRNAEKGATAVAKLEKETSYKHAELWTIDLGRFSSVREFVDKFEREGGRLDLFIANAAIIAPKYETTADGWESVPQVNVLSLSLLALLLLPHMIRTARDHSTLPRIVVVSSGIHYGASIEQRIIDSDDMLHTLNGSEYCTPATMQKRYHLSKILNILFVRELNARLSRSQHPNANSIIVNTVDPGFCYSELRRNVRHIGYDVMELLFAIPAEQASRQLVWAAVGEEGTEDNLRGSYITLSEVVEVSDFILSRVGQRAQTRLWDDMIAMLSEIDPRIEKISSLLL